MIRSGRRAYGCYSRAVETLTLITKITIPREVLVQSHNPAFGHALLTAKRRLAPGPHDSHRSYRRVAPSHILPPLIDRATESGFSRDQLPQYTPRREVSPHEAEQHSQGIFNHPSS